MRDAKQSARRTTRPSLAVATILAAAALLPLPDSAHAVTPPSCQWGYYAGGTGAFVPLFDDPDMTSPDALRVGRFFANPATLAATGSLDFDGDGKTDVLRLAVRDDSSTWWQYSPGGNSSWAYLAYSDNSIDQLHFGDLNADGYTDVVAPGYDVSGVSWYMSSAGTNSFVKLNTVEAEDSLEIGQFNGTGGADVFYTADHIPLTLPQDWDWFYSNGGTGVPVSLAFAGVDPRMLRFGDFDGDGFTDVFAALPAANGMYQWVFSSAGAASFQNLALTPYPVTDLGFGDFNNDGVTDVFVAADRPDGKERWEYWPSGLPNPVVLQASMPDVPYLGDFNGDGVPDAFVARCAATPRFSRLPSSQNLAPQSIDPYRVFAADIDGDGDDDLVFDSNCQRNASGNCATNHNVVAVRLSNGDGTFQPVTSQVLDSSIDWSYWNRFTGDVDHDGKADLIFTEVYNSTTTARRVAWATWDGSKFVLATPVQVGSNFENYNSWVGDFDGDGRTDVLWTTVCDIGDGINWQSCSDGDVNKIDVAFSTGGTYAVGPEQNTGSGWEQYYLVIGDVNGDGKDDIIWDTTCQQTTFPSATCDLGDINTVVVGLSNGAGQFTLGSAQTFGSGWSNARRPFTGDFNGDGRTDIAWDIGCDSADCESAPNHLRIGLATAAGTFLVTGDQSFGNRNWKDFQLVRGDVDGDGKDDLIWVSTRPANDLWPTDILVALSNGDGTFHLSPIEQLKGSIPTLYPRVVVGDLSGDGKADVLVHDQTSGNFEAMLGGAGLTSYCGDGVVADQETCDDGDNLWAPGQHCNATCHLLACGDPDDSGKVAASDALFILKVSVTSRTCDKCICDVDHGGTITASDALRVLRKAVGQAVTLSCAVCS